MAAGCSARGRRHLQIVVVVDVAGSARNICVTKCQRESRGCVIEIRDIPPFWGVAIRAIRCGKRGSCRGVDGIIRLLPGRQMATGISAIRRRNLQVVVIVDVALRARNIGMPVRQQKSRL